MKSNHFNHSGLTNENKKLPLSGVHVLLCEDCIDQGRMILRFLTNAGADVTLECNGVAAVETMEITQNEIHVVIMDFRMPEMDGLVATRRMRELGFHGGIIAVTAYNSQKLLNEWMEAGCDEYLIKPLNLEQVISKVSRLASLPVGVK